MRNEIIYFSARHLSLLRSFFYFLLVVWYHNERQHINETHRKKVGVLYQQTTHVRLETNPEKVRKFPFLSQLRQRQRGEINVLNNKILRTFETRGDFSFSLLRLFPFPFFIATLLCFLISLSFLCHHRRRRSFECKTSEGKNLIRDSSITVQHNFLLFSTFISRNYITKTIFLIQQKAKS